MDPGHQLGVVVATLSSFKKARAPKDGQASPWWVTMRGGLPPRPWLLSPGAPPAGAEIGRHGGVLPGF